MALLELAELCKRLAIEPSSDEISGLQGILIQAEAQLLQDTGFAPQTDTYTDVFHGVREGQVLMLAYRKVSNVHAVGIVYGGSTAELTVDVLNAYDGLIQVRASDAVDWPLTQEPRPAWQKWRRLRYEAVTVTYTAEEPNQQEAALLAEAGYILAAHWYSLARTTHVLRESFSGVSVEYDKTALPAQYLAVISRFMRSAVPGYV